MPDTIDHPSPAVRLRAVLANAPIVLVAIDARGTITSLEGAATEPLGLGADAVGRSIDDVGAHLPELTQSCRLALEGRDHTAAFTTPGPHHFEARYEPVRDEGGRVQGAVGVILEVTEHVEAQLALARSEERLIEADRLTMLGSLAGGIAHQINNALTSARLSLGRLVSFEMSRRPVTAVRLHRIELLQEAREGIGRVARVTRELHAFARIEEAPARPLDLEAILDAVLRLTSHELRHRAQLRCEYGGAPPVHGVEVALRQVFLNLLVNAVQSIPEAEAHLHEVVVATRRDDLGRAVVEISDTGSGIPPELVKRIFEPFFTTRPVGQGIGLGLAICKDTISAMGGTIEVESVPQHGTTVRVVLPSCDGIVASVPARAETNPGPQVHARILICDDDRPVAAAVALELAEHDVVVAGSGREALEILRRDRDFDVVLCDLMMPEVSGMDLFESVRALDPELAERFVFMTGGAFTMRAASFVTANARPCIEKPFPAEELRALIERSAHRSSGHHRIVEPGGRIVTDEYSVDDSARHED